MKINKYQFDSIVSKTKKEILQLILYDIKSISSQQEYDCSKWEEHDYRFCADIIEALFLPEENTILDDDYFEYPRKNIIRIHESVDLWTKKSGSYGYFNFLCDYIGNEIQTSKQFLVEERFLK